RCTSSAGYRSACACRRPGWTSRSPTAKRSGRKAPTSTSCRESRPCWIARILTWPDSGSLMDSRSRLERPGNDMPATQDPAFPVLTPAQIKRVVARGRTRTVQAGEVLFNAGDLVVPFLVVRTGHIEVVQLTAFGKETPIVVHGPGQFTGEANMLSGRRSLVLERATEPGELI